MFSWIAAFTFLALRLQLVEFCFALIAVLATILWLAHAGVFLIRASLPSDDRRSRLVLFGRGLATVALISFLPGRP
jgi:hypothetical protein